MMFGLKFGRLGSLGSGGALVALSSSPTPLDYGSWTDERSTDELYVQDFEGIYREISEDHLAFEGARVVQNLWPQTDDSDTPTTQTITVVANQVYQLRIGSGSASGATAVCSGAFTGTLTGDATNPQSFDTAKTATTTSLTVTISGSVTEIQLENVTGQANQNPSEYVSVGVAGSDGFAYKTTTNPCTVTSNVVNETGATTTDLSPVLIHVPGATNLCTYSNDFSNAAWVKTNVTVGSDEVASFDGGIADSLTATAANATCVFTHTAASAEFDNSIFIKRKTGTGNIDLSIDNGSTWNTVAVDSTWTRFEVTDTVTNPTIAIRIVTDTDAIYVDGAQLETGGFATNPIPTSGGTATRNATDYQLALTETADHATTGNFEEFYQTEGTLMFQFRPRFDMDQGAIGIQNLLSVDSTSANNDDNVLYLSTAGRFATEDGTNTLQSDSVVDSADEQVFLVAVMWSTTEDVLDLGYKNLTDEGEWQWATTADPYDGAFPSDGILSLFFSNDFINELHEMSVYGEYMTRTEVAALPVNFNYCGFGDGWTSGENCT